MTGIIVDEASILVTPSLLPLLSLGGKRLWILGDENQLKPTVTHSSAILAGLEISWMEYLLMT